MALITVLEDGLVILHRFEFNALNPGQAFQSDGDILAAIHPEAHKDIADAQKICDWLNQQLKLSPVQE